MRPWWQRWPSLLEREFDALREAGYEYRIRRQDQQNGRLVLDVQAEGFSLVGRYPDTYPYLRVEVYAPQESLRWHQNPFEKNLCLLGRQTDTWSVDDTLATIIASQLPEVIKANEPGIEVAEVVEERQAEPLAVFLRYARDSAMMFDPELIGGALRDGGTNLELLFGKSATGLAGVVISRSPGDRIDTESQVAFQRLFNNRTDVRVARLDQRLETPDARGILKQLLTEQKDLAKFTKPLDVVLLAFPDESGWRQDGFGWVFVVRTTASRRSGFRPNRSTQSSLIRAHRYSPTELAVRLPVFSEMQNKTIAVIGLGCLGAPAALEFARAGARELRVLDYDIVEAGTTVRWPLGISAVGRAKTDAIRDYIRENYPYTKVLTYRHRLGDPLASPTERDVLDEVLRNADLLFDATAERGLQHLLADLSRSREISYVSVHATNGAWGGRVVRLRPAGACWTCLQHHIEDAAFQSPPEAPTEWVQPQGCASPTFTGASFDLAEISMGGVRLAVATLCRGDDPGEDMPWDVGVIAMRDGNGIRIAPQWYVSSLVRHLACEMCRA